MGTVAGSVKDTAQWKALSESQMSSVLSGGSEDVDVGGQMYKVNIQQGTPMVSQYVQTPDKSGITPTNTQQYQDDYGLFPNVKQDSYGNNITVWDSLDAESGEPNYTDEFNTAVEANKAREAKALQMQEAGFSTNEIRLALYPERYATRTASDEDVASAQSNADAFFAENATGNSTANQTASDVVASTGNEVASNVPSGGATVGGSVGGSASNPRQELIDMMAGNTSDMLGLNDEMYDSALQTRLNEIEKAYQANTDSENAIADDARSQYTENVDTINEDTYTANEFTRISGEQRGIGNSAQYQALERGTLSRASKEKLDAAIERDDTLNEISERIATLTLNRDLDLSSATSESTFNKTQSEMAIRQNDFQNKYDLMAGDYEFNRDADLQRELLESEQDFASSESALDRNWQSNEAQIERDFTASESSLNRDWQSNESQADRDWNTAENEADRNLQTYLTEIGFEHDILMFDKDANVRVMLQNMSDASALRQIDASAAAQRENMSFENALEVASELNKYTPNTPEYAAMQGALNAERDMLAYKANLDLGTSEQLALLDIAIEHNAYQTQMDRELANYTEGTQEYAIQLAGMSYENNMQLIQQGMDTQAALVQDYITNNDSFDPDDAGLLAHIGNWGANVISNITPDINIFGKQLMSPDQTADWLRDNDLMFPDTDDPAYSASQWTENMYQMGGMREEDYQQIIELIDEMD